MRKARDEVKESTFSFFDFFRFVFPRTPFPLLLFFFPFLGLFFFLFFSDSDFLPLQRT